MPAIRLMAAPIGGGDQESTLSLAEKLRRERERNMATGITRFTPVPPALTGGGRCRALFIQHGSLYLSDGGAGPRSDGDGADAGAGAGAALVLDKASLPGCGDPSTPPAAGAPMEDVKLCAATGWIAFVCDDEVYVARGSWDGRPWTAYQVTTGARGSDGIHHGSPDYLAAEEFNRMVGLWWSTDGRYLCYQRTDERLVRQVRVKCRIPAGSVPPPSPPVPTPLRAGASGASSVATGAADACAAALAGVPLSDYEESYRFPFAGTANPLVTLHTLDLQPVMAADTDAVAREAASAVRRTAHPRLHVGGAGLDTYQVRVQWVPAVLSTTPPHPSPVVVVQVANRAQTCLDVVAFHVQAVEDGEGGPCVRGVLLHRECTPTAWMNVQHESGCTFLPQAVVPQVRRAALPALRMQGEGAGATTSTLAAEAACNGDLAWLWLSERSGYAHLYLYYTPGKQMAEMRDAGCLYDGPLSHEAIAAMVCEGGFTITPTTPTLVKGGGGGGGGGGVGDPVASVCVRAVTGGQWTVLDVAAVHVPAQAPMPTPPPVPLVLFHANHASPLEKHLYCAPLLPWSTTASSAVVAERLALPLASPILAAGAMPSPTTLASPHANGPPGDTLTPPSSAEVVASLRAVSRRRHARVGKLTGLIRLTVGPGVHTCAVSDDGALIADRLDCMYGHGPSLSLFHLDIAGLAEAYRQLQPPAEVSAPGSGMPAPPASSSVWDRCRGSSNLGVTFQLFRDTRAEAAGGGVEDDDGDSDDDAAAAAESRGTAASVRGGAGAVDPGAATPGGAAKRTLVDLASMSPLAARLVNFEASGPYLSNPSATTAWTNGFVRCCGVVVGTLPPSDAATVVYATHLAYLQSLPQVGPTAPSDTPATSSTSTRPAWLPSWLPWFPEGTPAPSPTTPPMAATTPPVTKEVKPSRGFGRATLQPPTAATSSAIQANACPLFLAMTTADGASTMYASISPGQCGDGYAPPPWPLAVYVYGGPHVQLVQNTQAARVGRSHRPQLVKHGIAVASFDGRGSTNRGVEFERPLWKAMGSVEVADQVAGVRWLVSRGLVDAARVGMFGWSYGGYMTLLCTARHPDVFRLGVAGAPVTDWRLYDTAYTERYMGHPSEAEGKHYDGSSVLPMADQVARTRLLLHHGNLDENVHFTHTSSLVASMDKAGAPHTAVIVELPGERHAVRALRAHVNHDTVHFLVRGLTG